MITRSVTVKVFSVQQMGRAEMIIGACGHDAGDPVLKALANVIRATAQARLIGGICPAPSRKPIHFAVTPARHILAEPEPMVQASAVTDSCSATLL